MTEAIEMHSSISITPRQSLSTITEEPTESYISSPDIKLHNFSHNIFLKNIYQKNLKYKITEHIGDIRIASGIKIDSEE